MIDLCIDARMAFSSGIGTAIRHIVPFFNHPPFRVTLLVERLGQTWCEGFEQVLFAAPIYSIKEQLLYPIKIPRCDLFWSPHYNVPLMPIKAKKSIVTIHDACHLALGSFAERTYARIVMHRALHRSNTVITVSQFSKDEIQRRLGERDIDVIAMGVNHEQFKRVSDPNVTDAIRRKYELPEKFILFVGNLKPHKNLDRLVQAFAKASLPQRRLVIVGKGKPVENTLSMGQVPDEDIAAIYSMAELFVFPSFYEGFGLPPLEAMSCGCPTAISKAASMPEVCGDASLYFHPERTEEIADAIVKIATDDQLRKTLVIKGFERVKRFTWMQTAHRYRELFEEVHRA